MSEFIINCIQSGAYSAVFAVMLVYVVKNAMKREKHYRAFIHKLCESLKEINEVSAKLDDLIELVEKSVKPKKAKPPRAELVICTDEASGQLAEGAL